MASGLLGKASLAATTETVLYAVPDNTVAVATVSLCNTTAAPLTARLAIANTTAAGAADYLAYDLSIPGGGFFERGGIALSAGEKIIVRGSAAGLSARAHGFEEPA